MEPQVKIILGPVLALLRSRKFVMALAGVFVLILVARSPELAPYAGQLILGITVVVGTVVGSIAHEDAARLRAEAEQTATQTQQENIQKAVEAALELAFAPAVLEGEVEDGAAG